MLVVNIFNSFVLIRTDLFVVHSCYVSMYNIQEARWLRHLKFQEAEIAKMFKRSSDIKIGARFELTVLLQNGSVYENILDLVKQDDMI